ncbi:uncharacterized protein LOC121804422 [Salvia splendens]|uniref:uncharacterized protein LOC121804422 n=1 Tax=Salvia splendens TaxID=180675 RepID=UPI001C270359|nr:uncharacterized protein LOC121804422 [Salvia splendens]XP_042059896.1 uncharacterized protein LOC121804422 [Salvia splendens]XP_042059897.1 uncharacterized protein LOC121804422 [Salvia splendens]
MAGSDSQHRNTNEMSLEDILDGTSARTRPMSYDEIMRRRKNKGDTAQQVSSSYGAVDSELAQENVERESDILECLPRISDDSKPLAESRNINDLVKVRSRRKSDVNASRKNENSVQDNADRSRYPDAKSKDKGDRIPRRNRVSDEIFEGRNHGSRKTDALSRVSSDNGREKRKDSESYKQDRVSERSRIKSEIVKAQPHKDERQIHRKRKTDEQIGSDSDHEHKKRDVRDVRKTDNLNARGREKSVKEKKHKHNPEEDKSRGRDSVKKNDSVRKGTEPTRTYLEGSRSKRRRSQRKDREKNVGKRSLSQSPKAHKHTSKDKREIAEPSSHSTKDKSGREHSNVDNKRMPSTGSTSHYRRNTNNSSGLGGYSPRKRKTEAAAKTPSPTRRSPEKRAAGWDMQPVEKESVIATTTLFNLNATSQKLSLYNMEYPVAPPPVVKPIGISLHSISSQLHAVESIQLTQATRPKRRLYLENLPVSASEKDLIECINKRLLSSGVNYVQGTQPCISCIIHKEKSQALLEFLTPEDASAALSLDGMSFSGSDLKLRRPKDYANVTTGPSDKSVGVVDSISDIVEDSPHKIFIGGISKFLSSRMLLDIARAFGPVKAFHFELIADTNETCAFLEYVDHLVTSKACAGLSGMALGGQVLTAVLATPEPDLENAGKLPTYEIPEHAKPLIKKPTTVLKLKNVLNPDDLISLSELELEEILEDIRLECSRFGMVRSINVAKKTNAVGTVELNEISNTSACTDAYDFHYANRSHRVEQPSGSASGVREFEKSETLEAPTELENNIRILEEKNGCDNITGSSDVSSGSLEPDNITRSTVADESLSNEITASNIARDEVCELPFNGEDASFKEPASQSNPEDFTGESGNQQHTSDTEQMTKCNNSSSSSVMNYELENKPSTNNLIEDHNAKLQRSEQALEIEERNEVVNVELDSIGRKQLDAPGEGDRNNVFVDLGHIFEPGSVILEYRRLEAACVAAHSLHGRTFDGRVVTVEYVGHDLYQMWFRR